MNDVLRIGCTALLCFTPFVMAGCEDKEEASAGLQGIRVTFHVRTNPVVLSPGLTEPQIDFAAEAQLCEQMKNAISFSSQSTEAGSPKNFVFANDITAGFAAGDSFETDCFYITNIALDPGEYEITAITNATALGDLPDWSTSCVTTISAPSFKFWPQYKMNFRQNKFLSPIGHPGCCTADGTELDPTPGNPPNC